MWLEPSFPVAAELPSGCQESEGLQAGATPAGNRFG